MNIIRYHLSTQINTGTEENPVWQPLLSAVELPDSASNRALAAREAYLGEYIIEDDGKQAVPSAQEDTDAMLIDHEYRLTLLELGLTE